MAKSTKKSKRERKAHKKVGLPPGSFVYLGDKDERDTFHVEAYEYTEDNYQKEIFTNLDSFKVVPETNLVKWINFNGLNNLESIAKIGELFQLHPLYIEDILNTNHRPKLEELPDGKLFIISKMLYYNPQNELVIEHLALFLSGDTLLTFQETEKDVFDSIRTRIEEPRGLIRGKKADYLLFCLLDAVVDHYFLILETLGEKIEDLEDQLINNSNAELVNDIQNLKREAIRIRRSIYPLREVVSGLDKNSYPAIEQSTQKYFRDLYDHTIQIIETLETYRDMLWGLMDMYMSSVSNKMNSVMKVLTIISTVFIPLTFIVGVYGMNFHYMPELNMREGYYVVWGVMVLISLGLLLFFKRKKWL
ncbi:MAG: magnesium/cobalt transporter CorA [Bacteroidetes bacterium]|nr:magnesium/cobalt transporter CorA [Bacteroidota bacterium]